MFKNTLMFIKQLVLKKKLSVVFLSIFQLRKIMVGQIPMARSNRRESEAITRSPERLTVGNSQTAWRI